MAYQLREIAKFKHIEIYLKYTRFSSIIVELKLECFREI